MEENLQPREESTGELKRLRDKSGKDELAGELKRSLLGGVSRADVLAYVDKLKGQWSSAEQTYKAYIADLAREKEALRLERDALESRANEQLLQLEQSRAAADPLNHPQVLELCEQARAAEAALQQAQAQAEAAHSQNAQLQEELERLLQQDQEQQQHLRELAEQREQEQGREAHARYQQQSAQYEATIAELNSRLNDQLYELSDASARIEELAREAEHKEAALRQQAQAHERALCEAREEIQRRAEQREATLIANANAETAQLRAALERRLQEVETALHNARARAAQLEQQVYELSLEAQRAGRDRDDAQADAETARAVAQGQIQKYEEAHELNLRLKETLSSLLLKAEALIRENELLGGQLRTERERAAQYQAIHERLVDVIARVRMANQLLSERVADVDRALGYGGPIPRSTGMPPPTAGARRLSMEPLNLDGGGTALYDMIQELNSIQSSLAQMQGVPAPEEDKKPNIRYSVEKLEVDCPPKKDDDLDSFRVMGLGEHNQKTRT